MVLGAVSTAVGSIYAALSAPATTERADAVARAGSGGRTVGESAETAPAGLVDADTLLTTIEQAQQVINICAGIQAHAMAHLAAHEEVRDDEAESGWSWKRHGLGHVADDTASLVASRLGVSVPVAASRVDDAVHQVTVTPRLVDAMGAGELDVFRAHLVTREVRECPDDVAAAIVDRLVDRADETPRWDPATARRGWDETAGPLSSRTRRLVARLAPEVAAREKERATADRALTRRAVSAAADQWHGLVPVEQSLVMWQAVDHLARELQRENPDLTLDQARVDALHQLVLQQADVTIHLHATHPERAAAGAEPPASGGPADRASAGSAPSATSSPADGASAGAAPSAPSGLADGASAGAAPSAPSGLADRAVRGVVELGGLGRPGTTVVDLDRLARCVQLRPSTPLTCHGDTGALVAGTVPKALAPTARAAPRGTGTVPDELDDRYRPSPALQRLVCLRDGHCRFPGCRVAARSCDLDHVVAWPVGATTAANLICLCRRHHRVKQRPGWRVRLDVDGVVRWTDPAGRITATDPVDHLDRIHHDRTHGDALAMSPPAAPPAMARARPDRPPSPASRMTRPRLAELLSDSPAEIASLLELSCARLLDLADVTLHATSSIEHVHGMGGRQQPSPRARLGAELTSGRLGSGIGVTYENSTVTSTPNQPWPSPEPDPPPF